MVVVSGCAAFLLHLTRILETVFSCFLFVVPICNLAMIPFNFNLLVVSLFLIGTGMLVLFGCWKFDCVQNCVGKYFGFLFHDGFRGAFEIILSVFLYNNWKQWYQIIGSLGCILGCVTGVLVMILCCLIRT